MLQNDGEFLIRDSRSSLGDYVLSCHWGGQALHFKIIRVVLRPRKGYSRTLFQFEQEQFDNVPALVRFYVGNRKVISDISGAVVSRPVNRSVPLRCLKERFSDTGQPPGPSKEEGAPLRRFSFRSATAGEQIRDGNLLRWGTLFHGETVGWVGGGGPWQCGREYDMVLLNCAFK